MNTTPNPSQIQEQTLEISEEHGSLSDRRQMLAQWIVRNLFPKGTIPAINTAGKKAMPGIPSDGGPEMTRLVRGHLEGMFSAICLPVGDSPPGSIDGIGLGIYHGGSRADCKVLTFGLDYDGLDGEKSLQIAQDRAQRASLNMVWLVKNDNSHLWHAHGLWTTPQDDVRAKQYLTSVFSDITPLEIFPKTSEYGPSTVGNQLRLGWSNWCPYYPVSDLVDLVPSTIPDSFVSAKSSEDLSRAREFGAVAPELKNKPCPSNTPPPSGPFKLVLSPSDLQFYGLANDSRSSGGVSNYRQILLWINYGLSYEELCSVLAQNVPLMSQPTKEDYDRRLSKFSISSKFPWGWKRNQIIKKLDNHWLLKGLNQIWSPRKGIGLKSLVIYRAFMDYLNQYGAVGTDTWGPASPVPMKYVIDPSRLEKVDWKLNRIRLQLMGLLMVSQEHQYEFGLGSNHARWYQLRLPSEHNSMVLTKRAEMVHMGTQSRKSREPKMISEFLLEMDSKYPIITADEVKV